MQQRAVSLLIAGGAVSVFVAVLAVVVGAGRAQGPRPSPTITAVAREPLTTTPPPLRPAITSNFPDPDVIKVGNTYYAYATNDNGARLPVAVAPALTGPWTRQVGDGLSRLGAWADDGHTWAPDVSARGDGTYLLYYTARLKGTHNQCIGVAAASSPVGPFDPVGDRPLVCPLGHGGAIDAASFVDTDGARYLLFKSDTNPAVRPAAIYLQRMTPDGLTLAGRPRQLLVRDREPTLIEAPDLVKRNNQYVLFYSSGEFFNTTYETDYAVATSITGPYQKAARPLMSTAGYRDKVRGPGGADIIGDERGDHIVFHGILGSSGEQQVVRGMFVADLGWAGGRPVVRGSPARYEAEAGRTANCLVRADTSASGGRAVAYIDYPDSALDLDVYAPGAGGYAVRVRYTVRSAGAAAQRLTVNGAAPGAAPATLSYPAGHAGTWHTATVNVALHAGWNTLRLRNAGGQTDVDYVEIA